MRRGQPGRTRHQRPEIYRSLPIYYFYEPHCFALFCNSCDVLYVKRSFELTVRTPGGFEKMKALAVSIAPWFKAPKTKAITSRTKSIGRLLFLLLLFKSIKQQQCVQEDWPMETAIRYFLFSHLFKELQQKGV